MAGVDEAGRGPLAGPVVAAAVVFPREIWIEGVDDSKKLTAPKRESLFDKISEQAVSVGIGIVSHSVIDSINILEASMRAMEEAIARLNPPPDHLLIDGPRVPCSAVPSTPVVRGDAKSFTIAAASIIAKVTRDRLMRDFHEKYPEYGFDRHKGYGTREHCSAILKYGPCEIHRRSFHMPGISPWTRGG